MNVAQALKEMMRKPTFEHRQGTLVVRDAARRLGNKSQMCRHVFEMRRDR